MRRGLRRRCQRRGAGIKLNVFWWRIGDARTFSRGLRTKSGIDNIVLITEKLVAASEASNKPLMHSFLCMIPYQLMHILRNSNGPVSRPRIAKESCHSDGVEIRLKSHVSNMLT
jgi:hypothetical protein